MIATAEQVAADLTDELAGSALSVEEILGAATATLSRTRRGTWVAAVMTNDPSALLVVAGDESDPRLAGWVQQYMRSMEPQGRRVTAQGMVRRVIETGQPALIPLVSMDRLFDHMTPGARSWYDRHPSPTELRTTASIVVPMRALGQTIGTLSFSEWNPVDPLDARDVDWIQLVADRLGMVVEHAQCHDASVMRLDRLASFRSVTMAVAASQDLRLTLQLILEQVCGRLLVDAADVLLVDDAGVELYLGASVGFRSMVAADFRVPIPADLTESSLLGRRFDRRYDARTEPDWTGKFGRRVLFAREGFKSYRAVSLLAHGKLVGMLEVFHRSFLDGDQEWLAFLEAMCTNAAIAVRTAALLEEVARGGGQRAKAQRPELSGVEWRILALVVEGATNREIAGTVHLSENTIKFHIRRLLDRVGAVNRTDLARKATQNSWL
jgi:DNA-binding CsgD family transcriptional regulator